MDENSDERIDQALRALQPKERQSATYAFGYIELHFDALEHAHTKLNRSYKELAQLLTDNGRPTKLETLKYNMNKVRAKRLASGVTTRAANSGNASVKQQRKIPRVPPSNSSSNAGGPADANTETPPASNTISLAEHRARQEQNADGEGTQGAGDVHSFNR